MLDIMNIKIGFGMSETDRFYPTDQLKYSWIMQVRNIVLPILAKTVLFKSPGSNVVSLGNITAWYCQIFYISLSCKLSYSNIIILLMHM